MLKINEKLAITLVFEISLWGVLFNTQSVSNTTKMEEILNKTDK